MRGLIYVNGIGRSEKSDSPKKLADRVGLPYLIFNWQQYIESESDKLTKLHTSYGSKTPKLSRKLIYDYAYDETSYAKNRTYILSRLSELIDHSGYTEVVLVGHSWGSVICYDYAQLRNDSRVTNLITTGCPLPFKYGLDIVAPNIPWHNFWEKNDAIAHKMFIDGCTDIEFKSRHWLKFWNLASHTTYFSDKRMAKNIIKILK